MKAGIYYTHYQCLGHASRMLAVAALMHRRFPRGRLFCVSGGAPQRYLKMPLWMKAYSLPHPFLSRFNFRVPVRMEADRLQARAQQFLSILNQEAPDIFFTEYFPLGRASSRAELLPSLLGLARRHTPVFSVAGYPVMPRQSASWIVSDMKLYRKIFILSPCIEVEYFRQAYALAADRRAHKDFFDRYADRVVFTNYLSPARLPLRAASGKECCSRKGVVRVAVVRGGGAYYVEILKAALEAADVLGPDFFFTVIAGPATTDHEWQYLSAVMAHKKVRNARLVRKTAFYERVIAESDVCVSTASYHTSVMLMRHNKKAVIIPFEGYGNIDFPEQRARSRMLADVLGARIVRFGRLSAGRLAASIRQAYHAPQGSAVRQEWFGGEKDFLMAFDQEYDRCQKRRIA